MQISDILSSKGYSLGPRIGKGSYAKVKIVERLSDNKIMAVKIINQREIAKEFLKTFLPRELSVILSLNHLNIIRVYEILQTQEIVCIMMEYASHGDLLDYVKRHDVLTEHEACVLFTQVCQGVNYLHGRYICHRDLKCENILLRRNMTVALSDFGFSRTLPTRETLSSTYCGSVAYASPELLRGTPYWPLQNDIWSLGCIMFIMVAGQMPFRDKSTKKMMYRQLKGKVNFPEHRYVSTSCKTLIANMLQPNADLRYNIKAVLAHPWLQHFGNSVNETFKSHPGGAKSISTNNCREHIKQNSNKTEKENKNKRNESIDNKMTVRRSSDSSNDSANENSFTSMIVKTSLCRMPGEACIVRGLKKRQCLLWNKDNDSVGCKREIRTFSDTGKDQRHVRDSLSVETNPSSSTDLSLRSEDLDVLPGTGSQFHKNSHKNNRNNMFKGTIVTNGTENTEGSKKVRIQKIKFKKSHESRKLLEQMGMPSGSGISYLSFEHHLKEDSTTLEFKSKIGKLMHTSKSITIESNAVAQKFKDDIIAEQECVYQPGLVTRMRHIFESKNKATATND